MLGIYCRTSKFREDKYTLETQKAVGIKCANDLKLDYFIYVDDVSRAVKIILEKGEINETYNIGSEFEYSVLDIHKYLYNYLNIQIPMDNTLEFIQDRLFNDFRYKVDYTKLINLGWNIETSFDEAMIKTIEWFKTQL